MIFTGKIQELFQFQTFILFYFREHINICLPKSKCGTDIINFVPQKKLSYLYSAIKY